MANQIEILPLATKSHIIPFYACIKYVLLYFSVHVQKFAKLCNERGKIISICTFLSYTTVSN